MRRLVFLLCFIYAPAQGADMAGRAVYLDIVRHEAALRGVPPELADAVAMVETGYRTDAIGTSGEIGIMQVMPATARQLGFSGTLEDLFAPANNIALGVAYLGRAWAASGGDICRALMKYRAGLGEEVMTPLSSRYCARAIAWLMNSGSSLGDASSGEAGAAPVVQADPYVVRMPAPVGSVMVRPAMAVSSGRRGLDRAPVDAHVRRIPAGIEARVTAAVNAAVSGVGE